MKKILSVLIAAALLSSLLAGCGGSGETKPDGSGGSGTVHASEDLPETTELSPEVTSATTDVGVIVDVGPYVLDGAEELRVTRQAPEENAEEGYKIESYDISIGDLRELDDFITIRIPYDAAFCDEGQDPARCVGAKYKNEATGQWEDVLFEVDAEANELVIYTDHLSVYGAFYVQNEGKRSAYISDVLSPAMSMDQDKALDYAKRIAADDASVRGDLADYGAQACDLFYDYADRIDNAINIATLGDVPKWLDTKIPDTNLTLFSALGYISTCTNLMTIAAQETLGGGASKGDVLNLLRDVSTKVTTYWADAFTTVGSGALSVGMGGVLIIDKYLTAFAEEAQATKLEDIGYVYYHFNESFEGFGHKVMTPKDWRAKVIEIVEKNPDDPDVAVYALEAGFREYASEFFSLTGDQMYEVASDTPNVTVKNVPYITAEEQEKLIDEYVAHLKNTTMPAVLTSVRNYMIKKVEQQELEALSKVRDYYNSPISITLTEDIHAGSDSEYKGYKFCFAPLNDTAVKGNWRGIWPESGKVSTSATLLGFVMAGYPHTVEFFQPDADVDKDQPEFTVPFVISVPKIEIAVSGKEPLTVDAFLGTWVDAEGSRMILMASGDTIIEKEPDLSWYGGDVVCTEFRPEYDTNSQTLVLKGMTTWVVGPELLDAATYENRPLELDASTLSMELTAAEVKDGVITKLSDGSALYTRP